jgi:hypothetical protein
LIRSDGTQPFSKKHANANEENNKGNLFAQIWLKKSPLQDTWAEPSAPMLEKNGATLHQPRRQ